MLSRFLALGALCALTYGPMLTIPLIADDYPIIMEARAHASWQGVEQLFGDFNFRLRATSYWLIELVQPWAGVHAWRYHAVSLVLHFICTLLVYGLARLWEPVKEGAFAAAAYFAIYEGHQEAVMWFSATNELLLFCFGVGAVLCFRLAGKSGWWYMPATLLFALAILSKESGVIILALLVLVDRRLSLALVPCLLLASLAVASVVWEGANSFRLSDGSFSLHAPIWFTLPHSLWRLFWPFGLAALSVWLLRKLDRRRALQICLWIVLALVPYSFLTYSTAIPSRHVYLASAGLAMMVGIAFAELSLVNRRVAIVVGMFGITANVGYVWTKKKDQFLVRAAPTEALLKELNSSTGVVNAACFPLVRLVAENAVRFEQPNNIDRVIWRPEDCSSKH